MTDRPPTDHHDQGPTTDQPADKTGLVGDQPPADQVAESVMLTLEEAAVELGISVNAVRQRIKRGTVVATKTEAGWLVNLAATDQQPTTNRPTNQPTNHVVGSTDQRPTTDLTPLAGVIEKQTRQISELSAAVGMWQARAMHLQNENTKLEERLRQLTATAESSNRDTDDSGGEATENVDKDSASHEEPRGPERDETGDQVQSHRQEATTPPVGIWARLRRWIAGE